MISRYNITMDTRLHDAGVAHARDVLFSDFSGLLTTLLVQELRRTDSQAGATLAPKAPTPTPAQDEDTVARFAVAKAKATDAKRNRAKRAQL